jgi:hypothetical protein
MGAVECALSMLHDFITSKGGPPRKATKPETYTVRAPAAARRNVSCPFRPAASRLRRSTSRCDRGLRRASAPQCSWYGTCMAALLTANSWLTPANP